MKAPLRTTLTVGMGIVALICLLVGGLRRHKIYEKMAGFGLVGFSKISDRQLVIDTTFSGVTRKESRLFSTYDRSAPRGKRACPS